LGVLGTAAPTKTGTTVASSSNTKAIAGGIVGAVAFVLVAVESLGSGVSNPGIRLTVESDVHFVKRTYM
jgi:hypothetical protein